MCLDFSGGVPEEYTKGYGFKCVNNTDKPDEFTGRWPYFANGRGGCGVKERGSSRNRVVWKIGRMYRVKHNRMAWTPAIMTAYPAGVHLYKHFGDAWRQGRYSEEDNLTVLVCYYTSAKKQDKTQIVAMRCTPLVALKTRNQKEIFQGLVTRYGVKRAIGVYLKRYND